MKVFFCLLCFLYFSVNFVAATNYIQNKFYEVSDKIIICANIPVTSCLNFTCDESDMNKQTLLFLLISIIFFPVPPCSPYLGQTTEGIPFSG